MGFFNEIKKVLFGAQSLGKSAANKAVETAKEAGQEIKERSGEMASKAEDFLNSALDKVEDLGAIVIDKAQDVMGTKKEPELPPVAELRRQVRLQRMPSMTSLKKLKNKRLRLPPPPPVSNPVTEDHPLNFDTLDSTDPAIPREKTTAGENRFKSAGHDHRSG